LTERSAPLTAIFPTRDNGARLIGGDARRGRWSVGWFNPEIATAGAMASGANEVIGRVFFAPTDTGEGRRLVQVGGSARWKGAPNGSLRFRAKPESNSSPDFADTKSFDARGATTVGVDALVQGAGVSFAAEGLLTEVARADSNALTFGGYYVELAWRPGGESRAYDARDGTFGRVRLREHRSAWELSARSSRLDLSSQGVDGGVFDRTSAALGWLMSESLRMVLDYGYGTLQRGGRTGRTQFFTARAQWELR
jgi:phosphate-selective porin OprO/OprP